MELIGINEIMKMTGRGRATVTRWLSDPECPSFPRQKHEPYLIDRNDFLTWYAGMCLKKRRAK